MKRHYPLMLNDITNRPNKSAKLGTEFSDLNNAMVRDTSVLVFLYNDINYSVSDYWLQLFANQ